MVGWSQALKLLGNDASSLQLSYDEVKESVSVVISSWSFLW